jgi:hypothetical protein
MAFFQTPYEQLLFETTKNSTIESISYEFLDEKQRKP